MEDFKDLRVWQEAHSLTLNVYRSSRNLPKEEIYGLTSQLRRAAASIRSKHSRGVRSTFRR